MSFCKFWVQNYNFFPYSASYSSFFLVIRPANLVFSVTCLNKYSQPGNEMFPGWEQYIPKLGINCTLIGNSSKAQISVFRKIYQEFPYPSLRTSESPVDKGFQVFNPSRHPSHIPPISLPWSLPPLKILTFKEKMKNNCPKTCKPLKNFVSLHHENARCEKRANTKGKSLKE